MNDVDRLVRRLDRLTVEGSKGDGLLDLLLRIANSSGVSPAIGVLAAGTLIHGAATRPEVFGASLDNAMGKVYDIVFPDVPDDAENPIRTAFTKWVETRQEWRTRDHEAISKYTPDVDFDEVNADDVMPLLRFVSGVSAFTMTQAQILVGSQWINVGTMRVVVDHVVAWWPLDEEDGMNVTYSGPPAAAT